MPPKASYFHLHLISDATCETLITTARAASARYGQAQAIEHIYPAVRARKQLDRIKQDIELEPGIVLYTMVDEKLCQDLEQFCVSLGVPHTSILDPVLHLFQSYLGLPASKTIGAQHVLNADYFKRIDALNFTLAHDDGVLPQPIDSADIILVGISRTSKTPTSIYLANRGYKTANMPLVPDLGVPEALLQATKPLIAGLVASPDRIVQIRQNRLLTLKAQDQAPSSTYVDKASVHEEIIWTRKLCAQKGWPLIDVTRKSIEETAANVLSHYRDHQTMLQKKNLP
jgi:regulator of PEP synthase PpsR (kinase-PPPase family)